MPLCVGLRLIPIESITHCKYMLDVWKDETTRCYEVLNGGFCFLMSGETNWPKASKVL
jgi:hypothetical protein